MFQNPGQETIASILREAKTIAVVGLSDNPERTSYLVSQEMQRRGYRIIPVNPQISKALDEPAYASLLDIPKDIQIDIVNVFRRSEALKGVVEEAIQTPAPVIWAQQGIYSEDAATLAEQHGKTIIMDRCIKVLHSLLVGR